MPFNQIELPDDQPSIDFPIGYTIEFTPGFQDLEIDEDGLAPRRGLGSQVLPVSRKLRADWDGVPADGAEYLFTVQQEARSIPRVVTKENPFKLPARSFDVPQTTLRSPQWSPSPSWRNHFINRFISIRQSISLQEPWHWDLDEEYRRPPPDNDESNWKIFILGKKANPKDHPPKAPIPLFLKALNQMTVIAVLSHYNTWIQENIDLLMKFNGANSESSPGELEHNLPTHISLFSPFDGAWLMGLLSVLDAVLTAEDIYKLRELARTCKRAIKLKNAALKSGPDNSADQDVGIVWMVITAVADVWGQKDLWGDL